MKVDPLSMNPLLCPMDLWVLSLISLICYFKGTFTRYVNYYPYFCAGPSLGIDENRNNFL